METLKIYQEYKFKKGGSELHISEGEDLKVRLLTGEVLQGTLAEVSGISQCFDIETDAGVITVDCENVADIIPV